MNFDMHNLCDLSIRNSKITTDSLKIFRKGTTKQMKYLSVAYNDKFDTNRTLKVLYSILNSNRLGWSEIEYCAEMHKGDYYGFLAKLKSS